ncbi:peptide-methionine (S)-S-oxide reductase MsrA [Sneathiella chinensis]|uniref:Peptide methionine sulfoxide reductase MsrA n=1 Tax=Sneathiella chinensis TaxID=349750 RepID=A0ABQ5U6G2_9PROT|nr:peptide-methionine (S)-S-oxide reductase MsrA [Sneathiella chinensis]GLQ07740.1 peptide methionine sulfoxide reductase MsrA [Sneathiella chinensis]
MLTRPVSLAALLIAATLAGKTTFAEAPLEVATFAGGCFWCVEKDFEHVDGVISAVSGYTGGQMPNPTYRNHGNHIEAVRITFDPSRVSYQALLDVFWRSVDPTDDGGQFCDRGNSYRTAIFANSPEQKRQAQASKAALEASSRLPAPIVTPVRDAGLWTDAEEYHQDYYLKNPIRYKFYRFNCGRDARIRDLWGDEAHKGIAAAPSSTIRPAGHRP